MTTRMFSGQARRQPPDQERLSAGWRDFCSHSRRALERAAARMSAITEQRPEPGTPVSASGPPVGLAPRAGDGGGNDGRGAGLVLPRTLDPTSSTTTGHPRESGLSAAAGGSRTESGQESAQRSPLERTAVLGLDVVAAGLAATALVPPRSPGRWNAHLRPRLIRGDLDRRVLARQHGVSRQFAALGALGPESR